MRRGFEPSRPCHARRTSERDCRGGQRRHRASTRPAAPIPTTLTLTLGVPTTLTGGNPTRVPGTPNPMGMSTATANTVRFTDPMNRFSFMRPANWQETKPGDADIVTVFVASSPQGIFNVLAKPVPANMTLDQYYNANLVNLKTREKGYKDGPMGSAQSTLAWRTCTPA